MDKNYIKGNEGLQARLFSRMFGLSPRMRVIHYLALAAAIVLAAVTLVTMRLVLQTQRQVDAFNEDYMTCQQAVEALQASSDFLTSEARAFVATADEKHMDAYLDELQNTDRRGQALDVLRREANNREAVSALEDARKSSDTLAQVELYALRLGATAFGTKNLPEVVGSLPLEEADAKLSKKDQLQRAYDLLHDNEYAESKLAIHDSANQCSDYLVRTLQDDLEQANHRLSSLIVVIHVSIALLLLTVFLMIAFSRALLLWPMELYAQSIRENEPLEPGGAKELRYLVGAYNDIYEKNRSRTMALSFEAHNDALTGLLNRGSFNELLTVHKESCALIMLDVDYFKQFNDEYGHEMGDAILVEVAATLFDAFRSEDQICRIGGDEFAVIMVKTRREHRAVIEQKIQKIATFLRDTENGLPAATLSVGIAFGAAGCTDDGLLKEADKALYYTKDQGRDGYTFADDV